MTGFSRISGRRPVVPSPIPLIDPISELKGVTILATVEHDVPNPGNPLVVSFAPVPVKVAS